MAFLSEAEIESALLDQLRALGYDLPPLSRTTRS